jgi:RNA polymerase sigma-70 factor (ECF subfamily)
MEVDAMPAQAQPSFAQLLEVLRPEMLRFAKWLARDANLAEDIVQQASERAFRARASLKDPAAARAWLLTIVRREHARLYERKRLDMLSLDEGFEPEEASPLNSDDKIQDLRRDILLLPREYREPLVLQVLGGFSTEEIAGQLGLTKSAVLTRLFRARNKLRKIYGVGPDAEDSAQAGGNDES